MAMGEIFLPKSKIVLGNFDGIKNHKKRQKPKFGKIGKMFLEFG